MAGNYDGDTSLASPITSSGLTTEKWAGILVVSSLIVLVAINRGFRGLSVGRISGGLVKP